MARSLAKSKQHTAESGIAAAPEEPARRAEGVRRAPVVILPRVEDHEFPAARKNLELDKPLPEHSVSELQDIIEKAFGLLIKAPDGAEDAIVAAVEATPPVASAEPHPGAARTWLVRIGKTAVGVSLAVLLGAVPIEKLLTPSSSEALVNAPVVTLRAPVDGRILDGGIPTVGSVVTENIWAARIEAAGQDQGQPGPIITDISTPRTGRVWEVLVQPGEQVLRGQPILRVLDCSAAAVSATVSESVYNKLVIGSAASFRFYGSAHAYRGSVSNLTGQSAPAANYAIPPATLTGDGFRVTVTIPELSSTGDCPVVGRHGEVVFGPRAE